MRSRTLSGHEEGVVERAGRMIGGSVEGLEVVVLGLHLGPLGDLVAHADEDVLDLPLGLGDEVQAPQRRRPAGKGDVDAVALEAPQPVPRLPTAPSAPRQPSPAPRRMRLPTLPTSGLCSGRQFRDGPQQLYQVRLTAQEAHPRVHELGQVGGARDAGHTFGVDGPQIGTRHLRPVWDRLSRDGSSFQADNPSGHQAVDCHRHALDSRLSS